ncbi:MAG TPA: EAL domain-containing protein [Gammaproteobacteria bacterium]|nr:EAL domain-containing protein [Gammaproteobacteria bacterium]
MNIEQKNTLFIISLVLVVLFGVAGAAFLLVRDHVEVSINDELERARKVFVQSQKNRFDNLLTVARSVRDEPSLIAATLTGDIATVRSMLDDLYPRPGSDFMAVYLDTGPGGVAGAGNKPHYTSPQVLSSPVLIDLVRGLTSGEPISFGNALLYDSWLQLVAVPIENPLGGRVGALVVGERFDVADLHDLRQLVYADLAVFNGSQLLASSIKNLQPALHQVNGLSDPAGTGLLDLDGERYSFRILPALNRVGSDEQSVRILLAVKHSTYWGPYRVLGGNALYFSAIILLLAALFGISISRHTLTRPIRLLARATRAIASGDMSLNVSMKRNDELGQLGDSLNTMLGALNASRGELEHGRQRFRDFAASSSDWLWETDRGGHFTFVSSSVSETLEMPAETWLGRTPAEIFPGSNLSELMEALRQSDRKQRKFRDVEIWVHAQNADQHCLRLNGVPVFSNKTFKGYRGTASDITKLKQDEKRMVILANQDHLTGLSNRRHFLEDLNHEIRRVERHGQLGVLLLIDLDHLKLVNDTAGHAAGDQIIVQVAGLLKRASREQDFLARISGDEFAVAYSAMSEEQGMEKAHQLLERINALKPRYGGRTLNISASVGVVTFPQQGKVPVELMAKADAAMSVAKSGGRNRVHRYKESDMMRERMDNQLVWKDRLLEALECDELRLVFQPIVGVASGKVHHFEVLVRMQEPDGTLIAPGKFIPAAEQFGLIQQLDRQVVTKAIRHLADLPAEMKDIGFSINLSGLSVGLQAMYELIEQELREGGVDPGRVTFEITETAACEQISTAMEFIQKVRQLGCLVSLDDFGVGFSSFSYLKHLRADILKIDGSFIRDIHNNNADQLFVKALVDVASGMGMRTIAEFVENEQVFERVRSLGVDYVQGYYLGKPQTSLETSMPETGVETGASASVA